MRRLNTCNPHIKYKKGWIPGQDNWRTLLGNWGGACSETRWLYLLTFFLYNQCSSRGEKSHEFEIGKYYNGMVFLLVLTKLLETIQNLHPVLGHLNCAHAGCVSVLLGRCNSYLQSETILTARLTGETAVTSKKSELSLWWYLWEQL